MLFAASALRRFAIQAEDGPIGTVDDLLFDEQTWRLRWLVVATGGWLSGRKVLLHPSAADAPDAANDALPVRLTRQQVEGSPDIATDQPVSRQMEATLYGHYGWDPLWNVGYLGGTGMGGLAMNPTGLSMPLAGVGAAAERMTMPGDTFAEDSGNLHLRSAAAVTGYHVQATDGPIGHVEDFLLESADWSIRYLVVDTKNWWPGKHVLLSPHAVTGIDWGSHDVSVSATQDAVKASPPWDPAGMVDEAYQRQLHDHYGWSGKGR